LADVLVRK